MFKIIGPILCFVALVLLLTLGIIRHDIVLILNTITIISAWEASKLMAKHIRIKVLGEED